MPRPRPRQTRAALTHLQQAFVDPDEHLQVSRHRALGGDAGDQAVPEALLARRPVHHASQGCRVTRTEVQSVDPVGDLLRHPADVAADHRATVFEGLLMTSGAFSHQIDGTTTQSTWAINSASSAGR